MRSGDGTSEKLAQVQDFTSRTSVSNVFIANINIMAAGVNLHGQCHLGILINFTYNAKQILQLLFRLWRIGQALPVVWHIIKTKNSFHDHQEERCLVKWVRQLSAEAGLPDWLTGTNREIVLWEIIKTYLGHNVNRYAWVIMKALHDDKSKFMPHEPEVVKLGHAISILAKMLSVLDEESIKSWDEVEDHIIVGLIKWVAKYTVAETVAILQKESRVLYDELWEDIQASVKDLSAEDKAVAEALRQAGGTKEKQLSEEFVLDDEDELDQQENGLLAQDGEEGAGSEGGNGGQDSDNESLDGEDPREGPPPPSANGDGDA